MSFLTVLTLMTLNNLDLPPKKGVWVFFSTFGCGARFAEMAADRHRQPAYEIFSTNVHF